LLEGKWAQLQGRKLRLKENSWKDRRNQWSQKRERKKKPAKGERIGTRFVGFFFCLFFVFFVWVFGLFFFWVGVYGVFRVEWLFKGYLFISPFLLVRLFFGY